MEFCRPRCWVDAKEQADAGADNQGHYRKIRTEGSLESLSAQGPVVQEPSHQGANTQAQSSAAQTEHRRLRKELKQYVSAFGAHGLADADLTGPLGHRNQHDVHDSDPANQKGYPGDGPQENGERVGCFL